MATISDLNVRLGLISKGFERDLAQFERRMQGVASRLNKAGNTLSLSFTAPLLGIGAVAIKTAGEMESLRLAMTTTMQAVGRGAADAQKEVEQLRIAALAPGLDFEQAVTGSVRLQSVGFSAEKARAILVELGNAIASSGGSADQLNAVTKQLTQVAGKGRVLQEDLTIILENMPSLAKVLRDEFGTTSAEAIRALGVSADDFITRITNRMQTLPRAAGGITNAIVNAGVAVRTAAAKIGDALNKAFNISGNLDAFAAWITRLADWFVSLDDATRNTIVGIGVFVAALGPAIKLMSGIVSVSTTVVTTMSKVVESLRLTAIAGTGTIGVFSRLNTAMKLNIFIAAASAVLALAVAFKSLSLGSDQAAEYQKLFADQQKIVTEQAAKETAALNKNFDVLKNATASTDDRKAAIEELVRTYPQYLKGVDLEKASLTELNEIQGQVNSGIIRGIAERQKAAGLNQLYEKQAEALLRIQQIRSGDKLTKAEVSALDAGDIKFGLVTNEQATINRLQKLADSTGEQAKKLAQDFDKAFAIGTNAAKKQIDALTAGRIAYLQARGEIGDYTAAQEQAGEAERRRAAFLAELDGRLNDSGKATNLYKDALKSINAVTQKGDVLGGDIIIEQAKEIENQIERLIENGFKPYGKEVQNLRNMLQGLQANQQITFSAPAQLPGVVLPNQVLSIDTSPAQQAINALTAATEKAAGANGKLKSSFQEIADILIGSQEGINGFSNSLQQAFDFASERGQILNSVMLSVSNSLFDAAASGAQSFGDLAQAAVASAAKVVRAWIQQGVAAAVSKALGGLPFPANLIAGASAGAIAGTLFTRALGALKIPALASGGIATSPTLAMVGEYPGAASNPEIIAPESKLRQIFRSEQGAGGGQLTAVLRGDDLLFILDKAAARRGRRK